MCNLLDEHDLAAPSPCSCDFRFYEILLVERCLRMDIKPTFISYIPTGLYIYTHIYLLLIYIYDSLKNKITA